MADQKEDGADVEIRAIIESDPSLDMLRQAAATDEAYQAQLVAIKGDVLPKLAIDHPACHLAGVWTRLSTLDNLITMDGDKIFVPQGVRKNLLALGHKGRCGIDKMKTQFRQLYYWPTMGKEIEDMVRSCKQCLYHAPSLPKEPLLPSIITRPMQQVGVDIFECGGNHYLNIFDRYSGFPFAS